MNKEDEMEPINRSQYLLVMEELEKMVRDGLIEPDEAIKFLQESHPEADNRIFDLFLENGLVDELNEEHIRQQRNTLHFPVSPALTRKAACCA